MLEIQVDMCDYIDHTDFYNMDAIQIVGLDLRSKGKQGNYIHKHDFTNHIKAFPVLQTMKIQFKDKIEW